jgi:2'-5' RNA ligase
VVALVESEGELERVAARFSAQTFTAHVTLARYRGRVALPEYVSVDLAVRLPNVGLYRSETLPEGARYTMLDPKLGPGR